MNKSLAGVRRLDLRYPDGSSARGPAHFSPAPRLGSDTDRLMTERLDMTPGGSSGPQNAGSGRLIH